MSTEDKKLQASILCALVWTVLLAPLLAYTLLVLGFNNGHPNVINVFSYTVYLPSTISRFLLSLLLNPSAGNIYFVGLLLWLFITLLLATIFCFLLINFFLPFYWKIKSSLRLPLVFVIILIVGVYFYFAFHYALQADVIYKQSFQQKVEATLNSINFPDPVIAEWTTDDGCNFEASDCSITGYKAYTHPGRWQDNIDTILSTLKNQGWDLSFDSIDTQQTLQSAKDENSQVDFRYWPTNDSSRELIVFNKDNWDTGQAINQTNPLFKKLLKVEQSLSNNEFVYLFITTERFN